MGFCNCINKTFLFILNFIVFAIGVAVISLASLVIHKGRQFEALFSNGIVTLPIWVLIVGVAITLLGFFGCCGSLKESSCMLYTYGFIVLLLFLAEITLGILIAIYPHEAGEHVKEGLEQMFDKYSTSNDSALDITIDTWQHDYKCCGIEGVNDWFHTKYNKVPASCCIDPTNCDDILNIVNFIRGKYYNIGCYDAILSDMQGVTISLGIAAVILAVVQVVCVCVSCGLAHRAARYEN